MVSPTLIILAGIVALAFSLLVTPLVRTLAIGFGLTDRPDNQRKLQQQPIPLGGGVAVLIAVLGAVGLLTAWDVDLRSSLAARWSEFAGFLLAGVVIVLVGLADDCFGLRGRHKLVGQIVAIAPLIGLGTVIRNVHIFGAYVDFGILAIPITVGWLLLAINAINLIDGADGLASTVGIILGTSLACLAFLSGHTTESLLLVSLTGALLGFLRYNFPPARMYLGDAGSMLIGLLLGAASIQGAVKGPAAVGLAAPLAVWTIPVLDTLAAIVRRRLTGRSIYMTDRGHLHHCLYQLTGSSRRTLYLVVLACGATCLGALASVSLKSDIFAAISGLTVVGVLVATRSFGYGELQLLVMRLANFTRSLTSLHSARSARVTEHHAVRLQGSRPWETLWDSLTPLIDEFNLTRLSFDVNIPSHHENYHVSWTKPNQDERQAQWRTELPLCHGDQLRGRLMIAGLHDGFSACSLVAKVMDMLQTFESGFLEALGSDTNGKPLTAILVNQASLVEAHGESYQPTIMSTDEFA